MNEQKLKQLFLLLNEYYGDKSKTCNYDCYNCELGVLEGYGSGHSCAIEIIESNVNRDLDTYKK